MFERIFQVKCKINLIDITGDKQITTYSSFLMLE